MVQDCSDFMMSQMLGSQLPLQRKNVFQHIQELSYRLSIKHTLTIPQN
jgi:hypothetical protein